MAKAVQQMRAPATETDVPMSRWKYLLTILARMSRPPVEALMWKRMVCEALRTRTKQRRSNQGSPMTEVEPASMMRSAGRTFSQNSMKGPRMSAVYTVLAPNSWPIMSQAITSRMALMMVTTNETFTVRPTAPNKPEMTMERPVMEPMTRLLGMRK